MTLAISQCLGSSAVGGLAAYAMGLSPQRGAVIGAMSSFFHIAKAKWWDPTRPQPVALKVGVGSTLLTSSVALTAQFAARYFGYSLSLSQAWIGTEISSIFCTAKLKDINFPNGIIFGGAFGFIDPFYGINYRHAFLIGVVNKVFNVLTKMVVATDTLRRFEGGIKIPRRAMTPLVTGVSSFVGRNLGSCRIPSIGRAEAWVIASVAHKIGFFFGSWVHSKLSHPSARRKLEMNSPPPY